jgi:hypothetical protein
MKQAISCLLALLTWGLSSASAQELSLRAHDVRPREELIQGYYQALVLRDAEGDELTQDIETREARRALVKEIVYSSERRRLVIDNAAFEFADREATEDELRRFGAGKSSDQKEVYEEFVLRLLADDAYFASQNSDIATWIAACYFALTDLEPSAETLASLIDRFRLSIDFGEELQFFTRVVFLADYFFPVAHADYLKKIRGTLFLELTGREATQDELDFMEAAYLANKELYNSHARLSLMILSTPAFFLPLNEFNNSFIPEDREDYEGARFKVATIEDEEFSLLAADLEATIDWGDGTSSIGEISDSLEVFGVHAYQYPSKFITSISVTVKSSGVTLSAEGSIIPLAYKAISITDQVQIQTSRKYLKKRGTQITRVRMTNTGAPIVGKVFIEFDVGEGHTPSKEFPTSKSGRFYKQFQPSSQTWETGSTRDFNIRTVGPKADSVISKIKIYAGFEKP